MRPTSTASYHGGADRHTRDGHDAVNLPAAERAHLIINMPGRGGTVEFVGNRTVCGSAAACDDNDARNGRQFVAEFSQPFTSYGTFRKSPGERRGYGSGDKDVMPDGRQGTHQHRRTSQP